MLLSFKTLLFNLVLAIFIIIYADTDTAAAKRCSLEANRGFFSGLANFFSGSTGTDYKIHGNIFIDNNRDNSTHTPVDIVIENNDGSADLLKTHMESCEDPSNEGLDVIQFETQEHLGTIPFKTYNGGRFRFRFDHQNFELDTKRTYCIPFSDTCTNVFRNFSSKLKILSPIYLTTKSPDTLEENQNFVVVDKCRDDLAKEEFSSASSCDDISKIITAWETSVELVRKRGMIEDYRQLALLMIDIFTHDEIDQDSLVKKHKLLIHLPLELVKRRNFTSLPPRIRFDILRKFAIAYTHAKKPQQIVYLKNSFSYYVDEFFMSARDNISEVAKTRAIDVYNYRSVFTEYYKYMIDNKEFLLASETVVEYFDLYKAYHNNKLPRANDTTLNFVDAWILSNSKLSGNNGRNFPTYIERTRSSPMFKRQWQNFSDVLRHYAKKIEKQAATETTKLSAQKEGILQAHRLLKEIIS